MISTAKATAAETSSVASDGGQPVYACGENIPWDGGSIKCVITRSNDATLYYYYANIYISHAMQVDGWHAGGRNSCNDSKRVHKCKICRNTHGHSFTQSITDDAVQIHRFNGKKIVMSAWYALTLCLRKLRKNDLLLLSSTATTRPRYIAWERAPKLNSISHESVSLSSNIAIRII